MLTLNSFWKWEKNESDKNKPLGDMHGDGVSFNDDLKEKKKEKEREWKDIHDEEENDDKDTTKDWIITQSTFRSS